MKKKLLLLFILFIISFVLFANTEKPMKIRTIIPEDYGVSFPSNSFLIDHIALEMKFEVGTESLIENNGSFSLSQLVSGVNMLQLSLLYYGNQSEEYSTLIRIEVGDGWQGNNDVNIPMQVEINKSDYLDEGFEVREVGNGLINLKVFPHGPRNGVEFANVNFIWNVDGNAMAGEYEANINISLEAI